MRSNRYDIFISYRREGGGPYARNLQLMLERRGYRVFLDYDELVDGPFSPKIEAAIMVAPVYIIVLSKGALDKCGEEGNWVRREIEIAIREGKHIVPVNPDDTFDGIPEDVPDNIKKAIGETQFSDVRFGQALNATVDFMVANRIKPYVHPRRRKAGVAIAIVAVLALIVAGIVGWQWMKNRELERLKDTITFKGEPVDWPEEISKAQLLAVESIFDSLRLIEGGSFMQGALPISDGVYHENVEPELEAPAFRAEVKPFYIGKYEVTVGQWNAVMNDTREGDPRLPVANVTFTQAMEFAKALSNLTTKDFRLPTETEWEYAAKGGAQAEGYMFAGSDDAGEVAWYARNSGGKAHAGLRKTPTVHDLFNMSGNVSEWCNSEFTPYDDAQPAFGEGAMTVRGGNYDSEEYEITVTHREPAQADVSLPTLGFRIVLTK